MNAAAIADGEFATYPQAWPTDDSIPVTLEAVLKLVFRDWGPGVARQRSVFNAWVASDPARLAGHVVTRAATRKVHPNVGSIDFQWRDCSVHRHSSPHSLWHFDKAAGQYERSLATRADASMRLCSAPAARR